MPNSKAQITFTVLVKTNYFRGKAKLLIVFKQLPLCLTSWAHPIMRFTVLCSSCEFQFAIGHIENQVNMCISVSSNNYIRRTCIIITCICNADCVINFCSVSFLTIKITVYIYNIIRLT